MKKETKTPWDELTAEQQEELVDAASNALSDLHYCDRDWRAWNYGTMTKSDFHPANEGDIPSEVAAEMYNAIKALENGKSE